MLNVGLLSEGVLTHRSFTEAGEDTFLGLPGDTCAVRPPKRHLQQE